MSVAQTLTKPFGTVAKGDIEVMRGKQADAPPTSTLEEADEQVYRRKQEIEELTKRPPSTSPEAEQKRLDDLTIAKRTLSAWELARAGLVKERAGQELEAARVKAQVATDAARNWPPEDSEGMWTGYETIKKRMALAQSEYQATAAHSFLKSDGKFALGQSAHMQLLQNAHEAYMDLMVELKLGRKVSPGRGVWTLERITK